MIDYQNNKRTFVLWIEAQGIIEKEAHVLFVIEAQGIIEKEAHRVF